MTNHKIVTGLACLCIGALSHSVHANTIDEQGKLLDQMERSISHVEQKTPPAFTVITEEKVSEKVNLLSNYAPEFLIHHIELSQVPPEFSFLQTMVAKKEHQSYGVETINTLLQELNTALLDRGYVTSKVYMEPQNIGSGTLRLSLLVGTVEEIQFKGVAGNYTNAIAFHKGHILNIRKIEQTVDNLNTVPHQKATVQLQPGSKLGTSIVVFQIENRSKVEVTTGFDNFGNEGTGRFQGNVSITVGRPLDRSDTLYYSLTRSRHSDSINISKSSYVSYQLPIGNDSITLSHSNSDYQQRVGYAIKPFISSGNFTSSELRWKHVLHRNSQQITELVQGLTHKTRHSFINGSEIDVQRRNTTSWSIGIHQKRYSKNGSLDWLVQYEKGVPWWASPGPTDHLGEATTQYHIYTGKVNYQRTMTLWNRKATYTMEAKGQYTNSNLYSSEFFTIGGWYTVRGFTGDRNLAAERGFYVRNTLDVSLNQNHTVYVGLDYGKVYGKSTEDILGTALWGGAIGMKGHYGSANYNIFLSTPLQVPNGFTVPYRVLGIQMSTAF